MRFVELKHLSDADFDNRIVRGVLLRKPDLDVVRVQDVGLREAQDPEVLAFAGDEGRVLLTHDVSTMPVHVEARLKRNERVPGVFEGPPRRDFLYGHFPPTVRPGRQKGPGRSAGLAHP